MRRSAEGEVGKTVASDDEGQKKERGRTSKIDVVARAETGTFSSSKVGVSFSRQ